MASSPSVHLLRLHISMELIFFTDARNSLKTERSEEFNSKGLSANARARDKGKEKGTSFEKIKKVIYAKVILG